VADPSAVRQALAEHGIPALVTAGEFCRTAVQPAPGVGDVVTLSGAKLIQVPANGQPTARPGPIVIYASRIPSGVELSIGYRQNAQENEISFMLIVAVAPPPAPAFPATARTPATSGPRFPGPVGAMSTGPEVCHDETPAVGHAGREPPLT
jgi:hypothetical protein